MLNLIKLKENNELNILNKVNYFKSPSYIYVPIISEATFKLDDYVYKNTYFDKYISSISGYIKDTKMVRINNNLVSTIKIANDFKENSKIKRKKKSVKNIDDLIIILNEYHLEEISNKILAIKNKKTLVVTAVDEEEYSIKEFIRLSENYSEILDTMDNLANILDIKKIILATKNTNFKSIKNVKSIIGTYPNVLVRLLPDKYLISYKPFLCEYLNINDNSTIVLTTNEIYEIYYILNKSKDICETLITVSGNAIEKSLVINVRLYTSLEEVIKEYIKFNTNEYAIFINGYLSGKKADDIKEIIITKDINSIVINKIEEDNETECINCGACIKICPVHINAKSCYFKKMSHKNCIGCGLCSYICPANLKLKEIVSSDNEKL